MEKQVVAITGAAGNLGSILAEGFLSDDVELHLLWHKKPLSDSLLASEKVKPFQVDLSDANTIVDSLKGVDTVIHFAGILFMGNPEKFLPTTNTQYFSNLLQAAKTAGVKKVVLFSFPHVEGDTSPEHPATGRLDGTPNSAHARTRLEEEKLLMAETGFQKVILRCGMVYGKGILMIDAAHWFSKYYLLGIWKEPNYIHLISTADYVAATKAAILSPTASGIYHLGDEGVQTLKEFLDEATKEWHTHRPWVMPMWMIRTAAWVFEKVSLLTGCRAPLTQDFITIGKVSYYDDTSRMRKELLPELKYKTFREGIHTLNFKDISWKSKNYKHLYDLLIMLKNKHRDIYAEIGGVKYNLQSCSELEIKDLLSEFGAISEIGTINYNENISEKPKNLRDIYAFLRLKDVVYAVIDGVEYNLQSCPELKDRWSEFEAMYYYKSTVVLNGVEVAFWDDGYYPEYPEVYDYIGTRPGYVILSALCQSDIEHIDGVPSDEIIRLHGGHPKEVMISANLIPRKYYDKVILYRHYLDSSLYFSSIKEYFTIHKAETGRTDKIELDLNNPNPDVLQTMIQLGVCKKIGSAGQISPRFPVHTDDDIPIQEKYVNAIKEWQSKYNMDYLKIWKGKNHPKWTKDQLDDLTIAQTLWCCDNTGKEKGGIMIVGINPSLKGDPNIDDIPFENTDGSAYWLTKHDIVKGINPNKVSYIDLFPIRMTRQKDFMYDKNVPLELKAAILRVTFDVIEKLSPSVIINPNMGSKVYWGIDRKHPWMGYDMIEIENPIGKQTHLYRINGILNDEKVIHNHQTKLKDTLFLLAKYHGNGVLKKEDFLLIENIRKIFKG